MEWKELYTKTRLLDDSLCVALERKQLLCSNKFWLARGTQAEGSTARARNILALGGNGGG